MRMIPATPHGTHSQAEKKVFDLLRNAFGSTGEYVAYHSINLQRHGYKRFGEIDFLVCGPGGIYVLEVKGGRITCENGIWQYQNRYGESSRSVEGPFRQAQSALHGLIADIREHLPSKLPDRFHIGYAVIFPDCIWSSASVEWDRRILADARDLRRFEDWLKTMIRYWQKKDFAVRKADTQHIEILKAYLRPEFEAVLPLHAQTRGVAEQIARLTEDQMIMLDVVDANARVMCSGGAGAGKTFLAVELARRWTAEGRKVALVCHSPWLKRFLETRFDIPDLVVTVARGISVSLSRMGLKEFDAVIIDEGQDLLNIPDLEKIDQALKGGLASGRWCFFYDVNNQAGLFGITDPKALGLLESTIPARVPLRRNCRNTRIIIDKVKSLLGADMGIMGAGEGPEVRQRMVDSDEGSAMAIESEIDDIIEAGGLLHREVTMLSPLPFARSSASLLSQPYLEKVVLLDEYSLRSFPPEGLSFSEISNFKGLENEAILVIDLPYPKKSDYPLPLHYVAMSRARAVLSLVFRK
jgi:hypothetical protein